MGSSAHYNSGSMSSNATAIWVCLAIIAALEINAIMGKQGPMTTVRGVIICGFALNLILVGIVQIL